MTEGSLAAYLPPKVKSIILLTPKKYFKKPGRQVFLHQEKTPNRQLARI